MVMWLEGRMDVRLSLNLLYIFLHIWTSVVGRDLIFLMENLPPLPGYCRHICISIVNIYKYSKIINKLVTYSGNFSHWLTDEYQTQDWVIKSFSKILGIWVGYNYKKIRQNSGNSNSVHVEKPLWYDHRWARVL